MNVRSAQRAALALGVAAGLAPGTAPAVAQRAADPLARVASGRVTVMRGATDVPVTGGWVVLHRVGTDAAGPIDSVRTDGRGAFTIRYRLRSAGRDAYFVSTMHDGLAYFSPALGAAPGPGGGADLTVYDTTSRGVPIAIASRHVVVEAPDSTGVRPVIEMYVLANTGNRTLVVGDGGGTFTAVLPAAATAARVGDGDVRAEAMRFADTMVVVSAPIPPGSKRVTLDYGIPRGVGRFALGRSGAIGLLDVLVEDSAGTATGAGLQEQPSGAYGGRTFRHFVASDVGPGAQVTVSVPVVTRGHVDAVAVIVAAVALALTVSLAQSLRRRGTPLDDAVLAAGAGDR